MPQWFNIAPGAPYFCVVGSPITHSRSPEIHQAFASQFQIAMRYERVEVAPGDFAPALAEFVRAGGRGLNITVPLKYEACAAAVTVSESARRCGAANTIRVDATNAETFADNTDGHGLVEDLGKNLDVPIEHKRVLILGAGGAAAGVIPSLLERKPASIVLANRTVAKAQSLAETFHDFGKLSACEYLDIPAAAYDLIVNATSLSLDGAIPPVDASLIGPETWCYDMMYTDSGQTPFLEWCAQQGAAGCSDGLGMLVEQAAAAFRLWHGLEPDTGPVIASLRAPART